MTYAEAAQSPVRQAVCRVHITLANGVTTADLYWSTVAHTDESGQYWEGRITQTPTVTVRMADPFAGQASASVGTIQAANPGDLDDYVHSWNWIGATVTIAQGFRGIDDAEFREIFTGYVASVAATLSTISVSLQSAAELLYNTVIPAGEYEDLTLPERVQWVLDQAGVSKDAESWSAWAAENGYDTRFHPTSDQTAVAALQTLLFGSVWGVGLDGLFFVHTASAAGQTADVILTSSDVVSVSAKSLAQYFKMAIRIPDIDVDNRKDLLFGAVTVVDATPCEIYGSGINFHAGYPAGGYLFSSYLKTLGPFLLFNSDYTYWQPWQLEETFIAETSTASLDLGATVLLWANCPYNNGEPDQDIQITLYYKSPATGEWVAWWGGTTGDMSRLSAVGRTGWVTMFKALAVPEVGLTQFRVVTNLPWESNPLPYYIEFETDIPASADTWGIYAEGVKEISLQYWDDLSSEWIVADTRSGESLICTGSLEWFAFGQERTGTVWRLLITDADANCKIYRVKMCNQSDPIENIEVINNDIAELNPLAKSSSAAITYIKAVDDAEDIAARALSLRSTSRKSVTVQVPNQSGLRKIYEVVELSGHRLNNGTYRVTGITEDLAAGKTTLELFR